MSGRQYEATALRQSNAERQRAYRQRKAAEQLQEVRGIFARPEHHEAIKDFAKALAEKTHFR